MNCPATLGCFCLSRTKLDNYYCVQTQLRWIDVAYLLPDITEKEGAAASKTTVSVLRAKKKTKIICETRLMIDASTLSENGLPQRHAVGTFDVCLVRPKVCPTDIVRPHAAQLMVDTSVNQFCQIWPSVDWLLFWPL